LPDAVKAYQTGDKVDINFNEGIVNIGGKEFNFAPLPEKLMSVFKAKWFGKII